MGYTLTVLITEVQFIQRSRGSASASLPEQRECCITEG
jgi:hypothetical protein